MRPNPAHRPPAGAAALLAALLAGCAGKTAKPQPPPPPVKSVARVARPAAPPAERPAPPGFDTEYPPERKVLLADWLTQHGTKSRPREKDCWAIDGFPVPASGSLLCIRTKGKKLSRRRIATLYTVRGASLKKAWRAVVGAQENSLDLVPTFAAGILTLADARAGACDEAVRTATEKAEAGVHDRSFVDLLKSACDGRGRYLWTGRKVERVATPASCEPPAAGEIAWQDDGADDVWAFRHEASDYDSADHRYVDERLQPLLEAYRLRDRTALGAWIARTGTRSEERTFGAYLLHLLGDPAARARFVREFPADNARDFDRLVALGSALDGTVSPPGDDSCPKKTPGCFDPLLTLGCAAIAGWEGAAEKLLRSGDLVAPDAEADHRRLLAELAASYPEQTVLLASRLCKGALLLDVLLLDAPPSLAARALTALDAKRTPDPGAEALRAALIPVLRWKATAPAQTESRSLNCEDRL